MNTLTRSMAFSSLPAARTKVVAGLIGLLLSGLLMTASVWAATITVGSTGDPASGSGAQCDVVSTCTLRDAIAKATATVGSAPGDTIVFDLPADSTITLSGTQLELDKNLTIDGSAVDGLAISGNGQSRVFVIHADVTATLKRLRIEDGRVDDGNGGGIINYGDLTLIDCAVANNAAPGHGGGGIFSVGTSLTLIGTTVKGNTAFSGGGIENWRSEATLSNSTIEGNSSGGIGNYNATMTLSDSTVFGNSNVNHSGGIRNIGSMTLLRSVVSGNLVTISGFYNRGGGIYNGGALTLRSSTVSSNAVLGHPEASASGGGIYNTGGAILTLIDSTVSENQALADHGSGGGIFSGSPTLINSTVSGNRIGGSGGGISGGSFTLINSTVADNSAGELGGGIYMFDAMFDASLIHATVVNNSAAGAASDVYNAQFLSSSAAANTIIGACETDGGETRAITDGGGNLDAGSNCGFVNTSSKSNATLDLGVLADNGGPTLTLRPGAGSDAIGHGVSTVCDDDPVSGMDQRGRSRSADACTSGAVDSTGDSIALNQRGLSGTWVDPEADSQGLVLESGPDFYAIGTGLLFAGWYTFDDEGAGEQRWYSLQGQLAGTTPASLGIYRSSGGRFASAQPSVTTEIGRAILSFDDCTHGTLDYRFSDGSERSGRIQLTRLLSNTTCSPSGDSGQPAVPTLLSGAWADTSNSAQGLVFDMNAEDNVIFAGWYTYSAVGNQGDDASSQRWYTLQATFQPGTNTPNSVGIYETVGGAFNAHGSTETTQVGTAQLRFSSCSSATLDYTFTEGANSGHSGTLHLSRVGATPDDCGP